jgi:hypothetical protein
MRDQFIQKYRGVEIWKKADGSYFIKNARFATRAYPLFNSAWSCTIYIDEALSP